MPLCLAQKLLLTARFRAEPMRSTALSHRAGRIPVATILLEANHTISVRHHKRRAWLERIGHHRKNVARVLMEGARRVVFVAPDSRPTSEGASMSWTIRIAAPMLDDIRADLLRPHSHAGERVGFVYARIGNQSGTEIQILPLRYSPVADAHYLIDPTVGAKIGSDAIRSAMQVALSDGLSVFHVHLHPHRGRPRFSSIDLEDYPHLVGGFRNVAPALPHGALLLSLDSAEGLVWLPKVPQPAVAGRIVIVGRPMKFIRDSGPHYA